MKVGDKKLINKLFGDVEAAIEALTPIRDGWQEAYDAKSEKWQESDKGTREAERISSLSDALDNMDALKDELEGATAEDE